MLRESSPSVRVFYPEWTRTRLVRHLRDRVRVLAGRLPLARVVLFGSYAKDRYTAASDIDVLVVYRGRPRSEAYALVKKTLDVLSLEPHVYSEAEFDENKETLDRMTRDGISLL